MHLPCKASVATSAESSNPSEQETVAPERSVGVLVFMVEVKGDDDMSLNVYSAPVFLLGLSSFCIPPQENEILSMSPPVKKFVSHISVDSRITMQVNSYGFRFRAHIQSQEWHGMPIIRSIILVSHLADIDILAEIQL